MYSFVGYIDPNNHVTVSLANMYGWTLYTQHYSGTYSGSGGIGGISGNLVEQVATRDNVLGEPLSITTTDEKPQSGETASVTVSAHYDDLGRVTDSSDPETGSFTYTYDPDGRLLSAVSGSRTLGYNYDLLGRIGCVQDAAPTPDADGSCTSGTNPLLQYTYDTDALGTAGSTDFPTGRLTKTVATTAYPDSGTPTASAITKYQYDTRGRVITTQLKFNLPSGWGVSTLPTYQAATSYNDADQATSTTTSTIVNNTPTQQFTDTPIYDQNTGTVTGLGTDGSGNPSLGTLAYTPSAQVGTVTFLSAGGASLVNEQYSYDGNLRLIGASACWQSTGCTNTGGTLFSQTRTFDVASNATSATTQLAAIGAPGAAGSETQIFCYDSQERLVWAGNTGTPPSPSAGTCGSGTPSTSLSSGSYQTAYQYTHLDQLWQGPFNDSGTQQYLYCNSSAPHQLTGIFNASATCSSKSGKVYGSTYDAWGNVITRTLTNEAQPNTASLSYDLLNQFIEWQDTDPNTNQTTSQWNLYDASGERVLQRATDASGTTTLTVYPFGDEEYHYTANGSLLSNLHYDALGGQLLAERTDGSTPTTTMLLTDALGSVISTFSNKGSNPTVLGNQLYDPYGTQRYQQGTIDSSTNRGFTGQYNDPLTGLDYYGARYYDPAAGVFLSADSVQGNTAGQNPYAYVGGNSETMTDPSGNLACTDVCGHGSGGGGGGGGGGAALIL